MPKKEKRIAICIMCYDAANTFHKTLDSIPKEAEKLVEEIFLIDDASNDNTYYAAVGYKNVKKMKKLNIIKNGKNLGLGGNQKKAYNYAIKKGYDILALLHGDNQYDPKCLPYLLKPLIEDKTDIVFGSRMMGHPLRGGMPLYKFLGNKFLTYMQNKALNMNLSEFHTGYRLFNCHSLRKVPFERCSNDFNFDSEIIIQFRKAGLKITELPIPTYYGDEKSHIKVINYGLKVLRELIRYRLHKAGIARVKKFDF